MLFGLCGLCTVPGDMAQMTIELWFNAGIKMLKGLTAFRSTRAVIKCSFLEASATLPKVNISASDPPGS
jgi:hypothetical protein